MKRADKFLEEYGFKRKTYNLEKEVVEVLKRNDWTYMMEKINNKEEIEPEKLKSVLNFFLEETGSIHIENKEKLIQKFASLKLLNEIPEDVLKKITIYYSYYFDSFLFSLNADDIRKKLEQDDKQLIKLAEKLYPEYQLKKIFKKEEENERASEIIDKKINHELQHIFEEKIKKFFYDEYVIKAIEDAEELVIKTKESWEGKKNDS